MARRRREDPIESPTSSVPDRTSAAIPALAAALIAGLLWAAGAGAPALAQTDDAAIGLEVQAGYGGGAISPWVPIEVTIHPTRLVAGVLVAEIRTEGGLVREELSIEVSAASRKVFRFLVPNGAISVQLHEARRDPVSVSVRRGGEEGRFLVGVLGDAPADAPGVRHKAADITGQWVGVDPAWAELSPFALQPLGALVSTLDQLGELSPQGQRNVAAAVATGTDIVVVVDRPGPVDLAAVGLPWQPAAQAIDAGDYLALAPAAGAWTLEARHLSAETGLGGFAADADDVLAAAAPAGRGRVAVVGAAPGQPGLGRSSALWSELVGPGPRVLPRSSDQSVDRQPFLAARLVQEPGAGVPRLPWLAAFIIAYVLVAGPVNGVVLARLRRRELAWITVPAITVVFTLGAFGGAVGGKQPTHLSASVAYWVDGVGVESVVANVRAPRPGRHQITMSGDGWTVRPLRTGAQPSVVRFAAETTVDIELDALQPGIVIGWRAIDAPAPMRVEAIAGGEGLQVRVINTSGRMLEHVALRTATSSVRVGTLEPREERIVEVADARLRRVEPWIDPFDGLPAGPDGVLEAPRSLEGLLRTEVMDGSPGIIWAVAVAGSPLAGAVRVDGAPPLDKGSLVAVGAHATVGDDALASRHAVARDLLVARGGATRYRLAVEGREAQLRFRVPAGRRDVALAQELEGENWGGVINLEVWSFQDEAWMPLQEAFGPGGAGDPALLLSPLGELHVRATGDLWPFDFSARSVYEVPAQGASSQEEQA